MGLLLHFTHVNGRNVQIQLKHRLEELGGELQILAFDHLFQVVPHLEGELLYLFILLLIELLGVILRHKTVQDRNVGVN